MKKLLLTLALLLGTLSAAVAQEVLNPVGFWPNNTSYGQKQTSSGKFLESYWEAYGFNNQNNTFGDHIRCGSKNNAYTAYISNASAISSAVSKFVVTISATTTNLTSATLYVADNAEFTDSYSVVWDTPSTAGDWTFEIPAENQGANKFYKFELECAKASNGFVHLDQITAYTLGDTREKVELSYPETQYSVAFGEEFESPAVNCDVEAAKAEISYSSSNEDVATVDATGKVTVKAIGSTEIKAEISGSDNYYNASASYLFTVYDPNEITLTFLDLNLNNASDLTSYTVGPVTFTFDKGTNTSNSPKAYDKSGTGRMYVNNTVEITVEQGYFLRSIRFEDSTGALQDFGTTAKATNGTIASGVWTAAGKYFRTTTITAGITVKMDCIKVNIEAETDMDPEEFTHSSFKNYIIEPDETVEFNLPEYAPEVTFTSSDENVITVEGTTLKAVASGEATITASWEATEIWKAGSAEFTVTVTGLYEDPEFSVDVETITAGNTELVLVNEGDQLIIPINYVGGDDPEFTVTSSNEAVAVATISADNKSINVDVKKRGRAVLTLSVGMSGDYDAAELSITIQGCYHDLASILENAEVDQYYYGTFPLTVALDNDMYNYVTDGTAWALVYADHNHGDGAVIPAGWSAKYTLYNGLPEFTNIEHVDDDDITDNEPVEFKEYSTETLTVDMANEVLILNDVEFDEATPSATNAMFKGIFGGIEYTFRNNLGKEGVEAGVYNVKAAIGLYKANNQTTPTIQIYPIEYMAQETTSVPTPKFRTYADGEVIEFEDIEDGAHILYRHGGEDPDHNNVFTESAAGAPLRAAAVNTDWTYNHTTHPLTFQDGQDMTVKYMSKKAGKAPSAVQTLSISGDGTTTGIENVAVEADEAVYYNLQGVRVANPANGIYVRIQGGKATKVAL